VGGELVSFLDKYNFIALRFVGRRLALEGVNVDD